MGKDIAVIGALTSAWTTRLLLWACWLAKVATFHVLAKVDLDTRKGWWSPFIGAGNIS